MHKHHYPHLEHSLISSSLLPLPLLYFTPGITFDFTLPRHQYWYLPGPVSYEGLSVSPVSTRRRCEELQGRNKQTLAHCIGFKGSQCSLDRCCNLPHQCQPYIQTEESWGSFQGIIVRSFSHKAHGKDH